MGRGKRPFLVKEKKGENNMKTTYWLNLNTRMIYKYYGKDKPLNWRTDWIQATAYMYEKALANAYKRFKAN